MSETFLAPYVGIVLLCTLIMGIALQRFYVVRGVRSGGIPSI